MIHGIVYYVVYGMGDQFWIFVKIQLIHQLNHNNVFEHLNNNNDKIYLETATEETGVWVQAGCKVEDFVGVLGGRGDCFASMVVDKF